MLESINTFFEVYYTFYQFFFKADLCPWVSRDTTFKFSKREFRVRFAIDELLLFADIRFHSNQLEIRFKKVFFFFNKIKLKTWLKYKTKLDHPAIFRPFVIWVRIHLENGLSSVHSRKKVSVCFTWYFGVDNVFIAKHQSL